jgi:hypothetical protein
MRLSRNGRSAPHGLTFAEDTPPPTFCLRSPYLPIIIMGMNPVTIPFVLNDRNLLRLLRAAARETSRVFMTSHAKQRMRQRRITPTQVYDCLRKGVITEPAHVNIHGHWQCTLMRRNAGDEVCVAAALERNDNGDWIAVVTVF